MHNDYQNKSNILQRFGKNPNTSKVESQRSNNQMKLFT